MRTYLRHDLAISHFVPGLHSDEACTELHVQRTLRARGHLVPNALQAIPEFDTRNYAGPRCGRICSLAHMRALSWQGL